MSAGRMAGDLWSVEIGAGPPLVLLHGNGESHRVFDRMVPFLAPTHRLVGLDSRGQGASPRGDGPPTIARMADDVAAALGALGLDGVDVLGFSDGGNIALELALRHPGRVRSLVAVGANLFPGGLQGATLAGMAVARRVAGAVARVLPRARGREELLALMVDEPRIDPAALAAIAVPVLVVAGERDVVRPAHTRLIADSLPDGRLAIVPGAGHLLPRTRPADLAALVEGFLAR